MKKYIFLALAFFGLYADSASAYDVYYNLNNGQIFKKSSSDTSAGTALSSVNPSWSFTVSRDWLHVVYRDGITGYLYKKNADNSGTAVAINSVDSYVWTYSADGNYIFYINSADWYKIYKKSASDSSNWSAISTEGAQPTESPMAVTPDGNYIFYTAMGGPNNYYNVQKDLRNTNIGTKVWTKMFWTFDVSPDWTKLLYAGWDSPYYLYEKTIADSGDWSVKLATWVRSATYSPDWSEILYTKTSNNFLYVKSSSDTSAWSMLQDGGIILSTRVLQPFTSSETCSDWIKNQDETSIDVGWICSPTGSIPDVPASAFDFFYKNWSTAYKKSSTDSSEGTSTNVAVFYGFTVSPDGIYIVSGPGGWNMEKRPASGGPWTQITTSAAVYSPVFSPDGNYVYYTNWNDGYKLYKKSFDNTSNWSEVPWTSWGGVGMKAMVVSPDGNYIYYWSGPNLLKKNLTDSSSPVTVSTLTYGTTVDISPDGTKLLYNNGNAPYYLYEKSISDSWNWSVKLASSVRVATYSPDGSEILYNTYPSSVLYKKSASDTSAWTSYSMSVDAIEIVRPIKSLPTCSDWIKNQDETGIDMGWVCSPTVTTPTTTFTCPANMSCSADVTNSQQSGSQGFMDTAALAMANLGDPIALSTGESVYSDSFLKTQAPGIPFEFNLTNKTRATYDGPVGFGWDHNNNIFLREEADGSVTYYDGKLGASPFPKNTDGTFVRNNSAKAQLTKSGGLYDITFDSGNIYHLGANLRIATIADKSQNTTTFTYDTNNRLTKVTDSLGRDALYAYFDNGRIKTVTDANGRVATLVYYPAGDPLGNENDLKSITITNPDTTTKTVSYQYTKVDGNQILSHNISKLVDAKGQVYVENTYDANDRVTAQKFGDGTLTYAYVLDATNKYVTKTTVTNKRGTVTEYIYDQYGNNLTMTVLGSVGTGSLVYTYGYDTAGRMISEKKPRGNGTAYIYDIRGNTLEKRQKMDMAAANNDAVDLVTKYVYDASYRNVIERTLPSGLKTVYTYDTKGNLTESRVIAAIINSGTTTDITINNEYDTKGRLTKSTDPEGNISTYEYGTGSVITKITKGLRNSEAGLDATAARVTTYTYDTRGNPLTTTDPEGNVSTFTYDAFDRLTSQLSAAGIRKNFVFSANNKIDKTITPLTETVSLTEENTYDTLDEIIGTKLSSTPSDARNLVIVRDKNENIVSTTDPSGLTTKYTYDALERVTEKRLVTVANDPTKDIVTRYEFDTNGNQIKITDPVGAITLLTYDLFDRPKTKTDALGTKTTYTYDTIGNITETRTESATGTLLAKSSVVFSSITRPLTQSAWNLSTNTPVVQSYTYDKNGNILTLTDPRGGVTTTSYSPHWQPIEITDPIGNKTQFAYDKRGLVLSRKSLTTDGKIATTSYLYDGDGRVLSSTDALGNIQKYSYDTLGRVIKKTDPANNITDYVYDVFGNLLNENVRFGTGAVTTSYEYDTANRVTKLTDAKGNVTTYTYDILGRKTKQTSADGSFTTLVYDAASRLVGSTDANGTVVTNVYDPLGRLTTRTIATGTGVLWTTSEAYSYDPLGRLITANDSQSGSLSFTYDSLGNLATESQGIEQIEYTYDLAGNRTQITTGTGYLVDFVYDPLSRLSTVAYNGANIANYSYTGASMSSLQFVNGVTTNVSQDLIGRLMTLDFGATAVPGRAFTYSANGNILSDGQKDYTYDVLSRLTQTQSQSGALTAPENTLYSYDATGNRFAENNSQATKTYATNTLNQYLSLSDTTASGATTFTYDLNGNILSNAKFKFAYDYQNRLVEVRNTVDNSLIANYTYDVLGRRTTKTVGDATTTYLYAGTDVIKESKKPTPESTALDTLRVYGNGADDLLAYTTQESSIAPSLSEEYAFCLNSVIPSKGSFLKFGWTALVDRCDDLATQAQNATITTQTYFLLKDHQNSTLALTDASGSLVASYAYDAFGLPYISTGSGTFTPLSTYTGSLHNNDRFFTGREYDTETALYHYRARTYDPTLGRFLQRDPVGTADQINLYTYVGNNPVRFVDPSGMVASKFLAYESGYIWGGVYNAVNSMSFEFLDKWTGINDKISNCNGLWVSAGWCDGKDNAYMLETASAVASAPSAIKALSGFSIKGMTEVMSLTRSTRGSTNFFGALSNDAEKIAASVTKKFDMFQCKECAKELGKAFDKASIEYEKLVVEWGYKGRIFSEKLQELVSTNWYHEAIKVKDIVFDNINKTGIEYGKWIDDLGIWFPQGPQFK